MVERFRRYWEDMMGYTKKRSSRQTFTDILNLSLWPWPLTQNPIFQQNTPAYDAVLSNQVWLQTDQQFRRYNRNSHILIILALAVTFTLSTVGYDAAWPYQVWRQNILWFRRCHPDKHSLAFWTFAVTLTLKAVIPFFKRTLQLTMLYYQTKFGCKRTSSLEDIVKIVISLSPCCDLDIEVSEPTFPHDILPHDNTTPYQVW